MKKEVIYSIAITLLLIVVAIIGSTYAYYSLIATGSNRNVSTNSEKYEIISAKRSKNITIEVFLAYIFPLFAFDFTHWDQIILFLILDLVQII